MDSGDATQIIILVALLALSAFFSSAETALTTVNRIRIRALADEGKKSAKTVLKITDDSGKMLSAILIGNNIVNLSAASLTTTLAYSLGGPWVHHGLLQPDPRPAGGLRPGGQERRGQRASRVCGVHERPAGVRPAR